MDTWKNELAPQLDGFVVNEQMICFFINDGRSVSLSVGMFPQLAQAESTVLRNCQESDDRLGLFWPELDLSISFPQYLERI